MTEQRPSRRSWPAMPGPVIVTPQRRRWTVGLLYVGLIVNLVVSALLFSYVLVLKSARDSEAARIKQQTSSAICDLLDQFPAHGVLLERPRAKYHCGPGLPVTPK